MQTTSQQALQALRAHYTCAMLGMLLEDVQRIERHYPVSCLGLSGVCEEKLALFRSREITTTESNVQPETPLATKDPAHALDILEAQRTLGLVPRHEYRRRRRELGRRLRHLRYSDTPIVAHIVDMVTLFRDRIEDGLLGMGELTERINSHRTAMF
ncbi:MAG: hypothetical protein JW846_10430 [Dehalococcoidia bacterium]|nr:hypothetical protein [Dehalococcoidia bacterium]